MIEITERRGLQLALAGHVILFGLLSLSLMFRTSPRPQPQETMDVQLVGPIGLRSAMPKPSVEALAESQAPEEGPPKEAPAPVEPEPAPEPKPAPKPAPAPQPKPKPAPAKPEPKRQKLSSDIIKGLSDPKPKAAKATGSRLGPDFLKGITAARTGGKGQTPRAMVSGPQIRGLASAIAAQVKPCYVVPSGGTDAVSIVTVLRLRFNEDGSVSGTPSVTDHQGVTDTNRGYVRQMDDAAIRAVLRCAPLKLPADLYEGGWEDIEFGFYPQSMR